MSLLKTTKPRRKVLAKTGLALLAASTLALTIATPASAATPKFTASNLSANVTGNSVTAKATIKSSVTTKVTTASICARDTKNKDADFAGSNNITISAASTGTTLTKTQTLPAGTYNYFACVLYNGQWVTVGGDNAKTFTVAPPASTVSADPSMPKGNLPGWTQTHSEDFNTPVATGGFPGPYARWWMSYNGFTDTFKNGDYDQSIISVNDSKLDMYLHTGADGRPKTAAPIPLVNEQWGGQQYGRFSVRMKTDSLEGYKTAFLLWSDDNNWNDGEIDFPEGELNGNVRGYNHCVGAPANNCMVVETNAKYTDWHTYTIDWTPERLTYYIDGVAVGSTTESIPTAKMHWVMQVETADGKIPAKTTAGHVLIDWATIYSYTPSTK
jgi:hypothetical protein